MRWREGNIERLRMAESAHELQTLGAKTIRGKSSQARIGASSSGHVTVRYVPASIHVVHANFQKVIDRRWLWLI